MKKEKKDNKPSHHSPRVYSNLYYNAEKDSNFIKLKHETKLLLFKFGVKDHNKIFDNFNISHIFYTVDCLLNTKVKPSNPLTHLITALDENWYSLESLDMNLGLIP